MTAPTIAPTLTLRMAQGALQLRTEDDGVSVVDFVRVTGADVIEVLRTTMPAEHLPALLGVCVQTVIGLGYR